MVSHPEANPDGEASSEVSVDQFTPEGYITIRKMAQLIERSYPTVRKLVARKAIRAVPIGGTFRIYESEVRRFLKFGNHPDAEKE